MVALGAKLSPVASSSMRSPEGAVMSGDKKKLGWREDIIFATWNVKTMYQWRKIHKHYKGDGLDEEHTENSQTS